MKYPAENWKKFGERVAIMRRAAGFHDMKQWAAKVERSTRMMQGLERGEPVGDKTLAAIAEAIGVDAADLYEILTGGSVGAPAQDASYVSSQRAAVESAITNEDLMREILRNRSEYDRLEAKVEQGLHELSQRVDRLESGS